MESGFQSELELTDSKDNNVEENCYENEKNKSTDKVAASSLITVKLKQFLQFFTVEPFLLCYIFPNIISAVTVQKLNMEKACRADLNFSEFICSQVIAGNFSDNMTLLALDKSQKLVAEMTAWKQPIQSGIPAIAILFIGAWSDKTGNRKLLMLIPILGELISAIGMILTTYYFLEWPLWVTGLIEALPSALTGGLSIALMGSYSFIADVTTVENRTFRMGCVAVIVTLGIPLGTSISGVLIQLVGYYGIFGIGVVFFTFGFLQTWFRVHDVRNEPLRGTFVEKLLDFFNPLNAWDTLSLLFIPRTKKLIPIWLVVWAHIIVMGPVFGESPVLYLYTLKKFKMDVVDFSLFSTYSVLMGLAGTSVAVGVLSKILKIHDAALGVLATSSKVLSSMLYGLAPTRTWFFVGPVLDFFGNSGSTVVRSMGTKVVDAEKVGKMCSLIGFVESVVPVIYTPLYSKVYSLTLETFSGAFYVMGSLMTLPAIFIFLYLFSVFKVQPEQDVKSSDSNEKHAYDNPTIVTSF
ncbi:unnamed protein product [Danaus chrysippus]|uniref:(African queen) hypothetical protein n=1 Tax=Danaus chrysippus TaxID=151541 RepID=A0A8J2QIV2_9NEOP|nr:unnamed protein product [Danaus chrysippus]